MFPILHILRDGFYLSRARLRLWSLGLLIGYVCAIGFLFATAHGLLDYAGRPLGSDFSNVYAAGFAAVHGHATLPFDPARQFAEERFLFGRNTQFYGWHYPPYFLLIAAPLATFPYLPALIVWQIGTLVFYLVALWLLLRLSRAPQTAEDALWPLLALGFTAVFVNLTHGHNGFLTAALLAVGLAQLDRRPSVAGIMFGLLVYKPQFALMIPLVLVATGRWRVLMAAGATVVVLTAIVTLLFGAEVWPAFVRSLQFSRVVVLEQGGTGFHKIQSVFAWVRLWGGSVDFAYLAQFAVSLGVAAALIALWRSNASPARKGAALCLAAILTTPYSLDYDLMILAPAIALLVSDGLVEGFSPWQGTTAAVLWLMPIAVRGIADVSYIPLGVAMMLWTFVAICRDGLGTSKRARIPNAVPSG